MDISICKFYFISIARKSSKHTFLGLRSNKVFQPVQHWRVKSKPKKSFIHSTAIKRIWYFSLINFVSSYSANQVLGKPDVYPKYGDSVNTWTQSSSQLDRVHFIEVRTYS